MSSTGTISQRMGSVLRTRPPMTEVEWCERYMQISFEEAPTPSLAGPWKCSITPYFQHWLNLITARRLGYAALGRFGPYAHLTTEIWLLCGSQLGKTRSVLYNSIGYVVDNFPGPAGFVLPRRKEFKETIDMRLMPVFAGSDRLRSLLPDAPRIRKQLITYQSWRLNNGSLLYFLCGEIAKDLKSKPLSTLFWDEFEELAEDIQGQGDPINLGLDRMKARPGNRLSVGVTSPAKIDGHGWRRLCSGSHERLLVRCVACGADQELDYRQLIWPEGASPESIALHNLARWACAYCKHQVDSMVKDRMVSEACAAGRWVPGTWAITAAHPLGSWEPSASFNAAHQVQSVPTVESSIRTGHLNSLYSQFISLSAFATNGERARLRGNRAEQVTHMNSWCANPTIDEIEAPIDIATLSERAAQGYAMGSWPTGGAKRLVLVCDQQGNSTETAWFPYVVRAFGDLGVSWLITCGIARSWNELRAVEALVVDGHGIECTALDGNNGMMSVPIQRWASADPERRIILLGRRHLDVPWKRYHREDDRRRKQRFAGTLSYLFDANAWKTTLRSRIDGAKDEPAWHLPEDTPGDYTDSLTAEDRRMVMERLPGQAKQLVEVWEPRVYRDERGIVRTRTDNHFWDCETMALAFAAILGWDTPPVPSGTQRIIIGRGPGTRQLTRRQHSIQDYRRNRP